MTDVESSLLQKKKDLSFYYEMAQEAFQANDVDQALKISHNGLEQAILQDKGDWVQKFNSFQIDIRSARPTSLNPSIIKEDMTIIKGIGGSVARQLPNVGINSIKALANSNPNRLSRIKGIGLATASKFIQNAKMYLESNTKTLDRFSDTYKPKVDNESYEDSEDIANEIEIKSKQFEEPKDYLGVSMQTEEFGNTENESKEFDEAEMLENIDDIESIKSSVSPTNDTWFEEKFKYSRLGRSYDTIKRINNTEGLTETESLKDTEVSDGGYDLKQEIADGKFDIQSKILRQKNLELTERVKTSKKILNHSQIKDISTKVSKELELSEFFIIKQTPELRTILTGIDLLAIRLIHVHEFLDLIFIVPIKICTLTESLIVSDGTIGYHSTGNIPEKDYHLEKLVQSHIKALSNCGQSIYEDIGNESTLFRFFTKYLHLNISLEKTFTHKNLFFRSGPLQYKILVEPVLVSQTNVGFTEKLIPFAYQKNSNIHTVEVSHLSNLLQYLDQKYFLIENYSKKKSSLALYCDASNKFMVDIRKYSAPFMIYGVLFLFVLFFQEFSILSLLINLGYGVIAFYTLVVGYIYLRFYRHKVELQHEFSTPYFQKKFDFDDTELILMREELSPPLMAQLTYEILGKDINSKIITELEKDNAESYLSERLERKKIKDSNLFESETLPLHPKNSKLKNKLVEKYSSFLED